MVPVSRSLLNSLRGRGRTALAGRLPATAVASAGAGGGGEEGLAATSAPSRRQQGQQPGRQQQQVPAEVAYSTKFKLNYSTSPADMEQGVVYGARVVSQLSSGGAPLLLLLLLESTTCCILLLFIT
jgi:hypothetical protein